MNSQKGWTRTTKEIILNGSVVKLMERLSSRSSNTKCGKYRPTDDALKYSFIFKNRNKHKEQREETGTIQRTDAKRIYRVMQT